MSVQHSMLEQKISGVSMPTNSTSQGGITRFGKKVYVDTKQLSNTKKRKKTKKNADIEKIVSFKPLVTGRPSSEPSVKIDDYKATMKQLPDEEEYLKEIPLKFFDHQIDAVRWMYWIEASKTDRDKHVGGILGDVMGLGKTIDGLGIIYYDIFKAKKQGDCFAPCILDNFRFGTSQESDARRGTLDPSSSLAAGSHQQTWSDRRRCIDISRN